MTYRPTDIRRSLETEDILSDNDFMHNSSVYKEFLAERNEILKHKWLESERIGNDVGFENALLDWIQKHRANWRNFRKKNKA